MMGRMASEWSSVGGRQSPWFLAYAPEEEVERVRASLLEQHPGWTPPPPPRTKAEWRAQLGAEAGTTQTPDGTIVEVDLSPFVDLPDEARLYLTRITASGPAEHSPHLQDALVARARRPDLHTP